MAAVTAQHRFEAPVAAFRPTPPVYRHASGPRNDDADSSPSVSLLLRTMAPLPKTLSLRLPLATTAAEILDGVTAKLQLDAASSSLLRLYTRTGKAVAPTACLDSLLAHAVDPATPATSSAHFLELEIRLALLGGKGGFGSMLRAQGGKMSARKGEENNDSCRDLNGRRLKTVKEAQSLAAYLADAPQREAALSKAQAEKYAKLEKMLGRKPKSAQDFEEAAGRLDDAGGDLGEGRDDQGAGPSSLVPVRGKEASSSGVNGGIGTKRGGEGRAPEESFNSSSSGSGRKAMFDDHKFLEESRQAVDKAKNAVAIAMAKKKKKQQQQQQQAKAGAAATSKSASSASTASASSAAIASVAGGATAV